jgi:hypothetical protein
MGTSGIEPVSTLLTEAEDAHGVYETEALGGVYDEAWAAWYATYLVEHGIAEVIGRSVTADALARVLVETFEEYRSTGDAARESWADWTARRLVGAS